MVQQRSYTTFTTITKQTIGIPATSFPKALENTNFIFMGDNFPLEGAEGQPMQIPDTFKRGLSDSGEIRDREDLQCSGSSVQQRVIIVSAQTKQDSSQ